MSQDREPASSGLIIWEAAKKFAPEELWVALREADTCVQESLGRNYRRTQFVPYYETDEYPTPQVILDASNAVRRILDSLRSMLGVANLVAWGSENTPISDRRKIPAEAWDHLYFTGVVLSTARGPKGIEIFGLKVYPASPETQRDPKAGLEYRCEVWLRELAEQGRPSRSKGEYRKEAPSKFEGLTKRGFDQRVWNSVVKDHPNWAKPGRKPRKNNI